MIFLSRSDLESLQITTREQVDALRALVLGKIEGNVHAAPKTAAATADGRYMMATLSASDDPPLMAVKSVIVNQENTRQGLEAINGSIMLLDSRTGLPLAFMDGNWITAVRTAAASALMAEYLAREDASVIAFIGAGVQARSHLMALHDLFPLTAVRAVGRGAANLEKLGSLAEGLGMTMTVCDEATDAVRAADIVVTSLPITSRVAPFVNANDLKEGAFLASTDLAMPFERESMKAFDRLVIDDLAQEAAMPDPMVAVDLVAGDIAGIVSGQVPARQTPVERTAFVFRAVGLGDLALATLAYNKATARGRGQRIEPG